MNKIYALRYSTLLRAVVVVSEHCRRRARGTASGGGSRRRLFRISALAAALAGSFAPSAYAMPGGGQVVAGQVSIQQASATTMNVVQTTGSGIVNWNSFGIGANETVNFVQPGSSSVTLNRVVGADPSAIFGHLNANGQVFLVNPNGVLFAPGASVNVGGIVASTLSISDADFLAGKYHFSGGGQGDVSNEGTIRTANGGYVALIGPRVSNSGTISADHGGIALGAGATVDMTLAGNALETFQVSAAALDALVANGGAIRAAGGTVILSAQAKDALLQTVVNNSGLISADSVSDQGGTVTLLGVGGAVQDSGSVSASSQDAAGGHIALSGDSVEVGAAAQLVARGASAGGSIEVGGDLHGGSLPLATTTSVDSGALLDASATGNGNGGSIEVVSDLGNAAALTRVAGTLRADGGAQGGNGGAIETSGPTLATDGITVQATAPHGQAGQWLLDPTMVQINSTDSGTTSSTAGGTTTYSGTGTSYVSAATIDTALNSGTNVTVETSGLANNGAFDVWVLAPIQKTAGGDATLTLQAANSVYIGAPISSSSGALNLNLYAGNNGGTLTGTGAVLLASDITTNGGNINFGTNQSHTYSSGVTQLAGGDVYVDSQLSSANGGGSASSQLVKLDTTSASGSGGSVNVYGQTVIANPAGFEIDTAHTGSSGSDGNVLFAGTVDSGNTYQYVAINSTWDNALTSAKSGTGANVGDTYLATVPTSLLNAVASFTTGYTQAWLGAERLVASTVTGTPDPTDTTSLDNVWYWVTGPLGLVANSSSPTGYGTAFFTQAGSTTQNGQNGTAINGAYTNWNPATSVRAGNLGTQGEPNNYNGSNMTPSGAKEYVLQFVGTAGQWNDLPPGNQMGYVKETNLAAAPLTVNSGTGTITLGAGVGSNAPLLSFNVTGNVVALPQNPTINTTNGANFTTTNGGTSQVEVNDGSGNYIPTQLLTISAQSASQTYGATPPSALPITYTPMGGSTSTTPPTGVGSAGAAWSVTPTSTSDVGLYQDVVSGATWNGGGSNPYTFVYQNGTFTIAPATLTVSGLSASSRAYNGSTAIALSGTPSLQGLMNGNTATLSGNTATGSVASADVQMLNGVAQSQVVTTALGFSLTSGNAADYVFAQPSLSATITPATVSVSGLSGQSRTYNGSDIVALSGTPTITGLVGNDQASVSNLVGTVPSANVQWNNGVAQAQTVTPQLQYTLTSGNANDYQFVQPSGLSATITPAPLTISGLSSTDMAYNGTLNDPLGVDPQLGTISLNGLQNNEQLVLTNTGFGTLSNANAGTRTVTANVQLNNGSGLASNYALTEPTLASVTVSPATLTVLSGLTPVDRSYNGSTTVALSGTPRFSGLVNGQTVTVTNLSTGGLAASANAGSEPVNANLQLANGSGLASNYVVAASSLGNVTITPATLSVTGETASGKVYDGGTTATLSGGSLVGVIGNDAVTLGQAGNFASPNVGSNIAITAADTLSGTDAGNYQLTQPTGLSASITPATLTVSGETASGKVYDGGTAATLSGGQLVGVIGQDSVTLGQAGNFASRNVGSNIAITAADTLSGTDAGNYQLTQPTGLSAGITPATLSVSGQGALGKVYDGTSAVTPLGGTLTGIVAGDQVGLVADASVPLNTIGANVPVTFHDTLSGADAGNYAVSQPQGVTVAIYPPPQNVVAPVQAGNPAPAANATSTTVSQVNVPPVVFSGASSTSTSIVVLNGGVNAPGGAQQQDGFTQTLPPLSSGPLIGSGINVLQGPQDQQGS